MHIQLEQKQWQGRGGDKKKTSTKQHEKKEQGPLDALALALASPSTTKLTQLIQVRQLEALQQNKSGGQAKKKAQHQYNALFPPSSLTRTAEDAEEQLNAEDSTDSGLSPYLKYDNCLANSRTAKRQQRMLSSSTPSSAAKGTKSNRTITGLITPEARLEEERIRQAAKETQNTETIFEILKNELEQIESWYQRYLITRDVNEQSTMIKRYISQASQFLDKTRVLLYRHLFSFTHERSLPPHETPSLKMKKMMQDPHAMLLLLQRHLNELNDQLFDLSHMQMHMHMPGYEVKFEQIRQNLCLSLLGLYRKHVRLQQNHPYLQRLFPWEKDLTAYGASLAEYLIRAHSLPTSMNDEMMESISIVPPAPPLVGVELNPGPPREGHSDTPAAAASSSSSSVRQRSAPSRSSKHPLDTHRETSPQIRQRVGSSAASSTSAASHRVPPVEEDIDMEDEEGDSDDQEDDEDDEDEEEMAQEEEEGEKQEEEKQSHLPAIDEAVSRLESRQGFDPVAAKEVIVTNIEQFLRLGPYSYPISRGSKTYRKIGEHVDDMMRYSTSLNGICEHEIFLHPWSKKAQYALFVQQATNKNETSAHVESGQIYLIGKLVAATSGSGIASFPHCQVRPVDASIRQSAVDLLPHITENSLVRSIFHTDHDTVIKYHPIRFTNASQLGTVSVPMQQGENFDRDEIFRQFIQPVVELSSMGGGGGQVLVGEIESVLSPVDVKLVSTGDFDVHLNRDGLPPPSGPQYARMLHILKTLYSKSSVQSHEIEDFKTWRIPKTDDPTVLSFSKFCFLSIPPPYRKYMNLTVRTFQFWCWMLMLFLKSLNKKKKTKAFVTSQSPTTSRSRSPARSSVVSTAVPPSNTRLSFFTASHIRAQHTRSAPPPISTQRIPTTTASASTTSAASAAAIVATTGLPPTIAAPGPAIAAPGPAIKVEGEEAEVCTRVSNHFTRFMQKKKLTGSMKADIAVIAGVGSKRTPTFVVEVKKESVLIDLFEKLKKLELNEEQLATAKSYIPAALDALEKKINTLRAVNQHEKDTEEINEFLSTFESIQGWYLQLVRCMLAIETTLSPNPENPTEAEVARYGALATPTCFVFVKVLVVPISTGAAVPMKKCPRQLHILSSEIFRLSDPSPSTQYDLTIKQRFLACITAGANSAPLQSVTAYPNAQQRTDFARRIQERLEADEMSFSTLPTSESTAASASHSTRGRRSPSTTHGGRRRSDQVPSLESVCSTLVGVALPPLPAHVNPEDESRWPLHRFATSATRTQLVFKLKSMDLSQDKPLYALKLGLQDDDHNESDLYSEIKREGEYYKKFLSLPNIVVPQVAYQGEVVHNNRIYYALITSYSGPTLYEFAYHTSNANEIKMYIDMDDSEATVARTKLVDSVILAATSSLSEFHKMDLVHGDIKADNLLVTGNADGKNIKVILIDFTHTAPQNHTPITVESEQASLITMIKNTFSVTDSSLHEGH